MMMKKYASLLFALVLALSLSVSAAADADVYVYDDADILSTDECAALNEAAAAVADQYGCGVYVVTVDDMADYIDPDAVTETDETAWPPSPNTRGMRSGLPPPTTATASCSR